MNIFRRLSLTIFVVTLFLTQARAQQPEFHYQIVLPESARIGGPPNTTVRFPARVQLITRGVESGTEGPRGWQVAVKAEDDWRIADATTEATVAAHKEKGGLFDGGFEKTELTSGPGNEGAISAIVLALTKEVSIPSEKSPVDILSLVVEGETPGEGCQSRVITFADPLQGEGEPVENIVSWKDDSFRPILHPAEFVVCALCFEDEPRIGRWRSVNVGANYAGSARSSSEADHAANEGCFEICGIGEGRRAGELLGDDFHALVTKGRANMSLVVELTNLDGPGAAGVEIRREPRVAASEYVGISVQRNPDGELILISSMRREKGAKVEILDQVTVGALPIFLGVQREDESISTSFGTTRDRLGINASIDVEEIRVLSAMTQNILMSCGSNGPSGPRSVATFCAPSLEIDETVTPPVITDVQPTIWARDGETRFKITGRDLCPEAGLTAVTIEGVEAEVVECSDEAIVAIARAPDTEGAASQVFRANITVETPLGSGIVPGGVLFAGRRVERGECNCDGSLDITDPIGKLGFLFLGNDPCCCDSAADSNVDGNLDISDPLKDLASLFLTGVPLPSIDDEELITPCDLPPAPTVLSISSEFIEEGDVVEIVGSDFSPKPEENIIMFGVQRAQVMEASTTSLLVSVPKLVGVSSVEPLSVTVLRAHAFISLSPTINSCKLKQCGANLIPGLLSRSKVPVDFEPSRNQSVLATSSVDVNKGVISLNFNKDTFDPSQSVDIVGNLELSPTQGLSYGSISYRSSYSDSYARSFDDYLEGIGYTLRHDFQSDVGLKGVTRVNVVPGEDKIDIHLDDAVLETAPDPSRLGSFVLTWEKCLCDGFDPELDEREYGWCKFTELITPCAGFPKWMHFIPDGLVFQQASNIFPLDAPDEYASFEKRVLYNRSAYCHVRKHNLWNRCKLEKLDDAGETEVPEFPCKAVVMKTQWRTAAQLPAVPDPNNLYYHYDDNGTERYLTLLHFTDKSRQDWFWADLYVDVSDGGDTGGCGGSKVGMPAGQAPWVTPWSNYSMCTNISDTPGNDCGNMEIPIECGQTCQDCHEGSSFGSTPLQLDFLFSLDGGPNIPGSPDCD